MRRTRSARGEAEPRARLVDFRYTRPQAARILRSVGMRPGDDRSRWFIDKVEKIASVKWHGMSTWEAAAHRRALAAFEAAVAALEQRYAALGERARLVIDPPGLPREIRVPAALAALGEARASARAELGALSTRGLPRGRRARERAIGFVMELLDWYRVATGRSAGRHVDPLTGAEQETAFEGFVRACLTPTGMVPHGVNVRWLVRAALTRQRRRTQEGVASALAFLGLMVKRLASRRAGEREAGRRAWDWLLHCLLWRFCARMDDDLTEFAPRRDDQFTLIGLLLATGRDPQDLARELARLGKALASRERRRRTRAHAEFYALMQTLAAQHAPRRGWAAARAMGFIRPRRTK